MDLNLDGCAWLTRDAERGASDQKRECTSNAHSSNENKMSDGWREGASLRIEGGISWKIKNQSRQAFAPSHG